MNDEQQSKFQEQVRLDRKSYRQFVGTPAGTELLKWLDEASKSAVKDAMSARGVAERIASLDEARAYFNVLEHIEAMSSGED